MSSGNTAHYPVMVMVAVKHLHPLLPSRVQRTLSSPAHPWEVAHYPFATRASGVNNRSGAPPWHSGCSCHCVPPP